MSIYLEVKASIGGHVYDVVPDMVALAAKLLIPIHLNANNGRLLIVNPGASSTQVIAAWANNDNHEKPARIVSVAAKETKYDEIVEQLTSEIDEYYHNYRKAIAPTLIMTEDVCTRLIVALGGLLRTDQPWKELLQIHGCKVVTFPDDRACGEQTAIMRSMNQAVLYFNPEPKGK